MARIRHDDRDDVRRLDTVVAFDGLSVDEDTPGLGGLLDAVAARMWQTVGQKFVDADQRLIFIGYKTKMFSGAK